MAPIRRLESHWNIYAMCESNQEETGNEEIEDVIRDAANGPKSVTVDGTNVQSHGLEELIKADQHLTGKTGAGKKHRGIYFSKLVPPGT